MSKKTNFFKEITDLMIGNSILNIRILKNESGRMGVVIYPEFDDDLVDKNKIPSFSLGGNPEEIDESFFESIEEIMDASNAVFGSIDKFKEQLSLIKKDAEKKVKDETKSSTSKTTKKSSKADTQQKMIEDKTDKETGEIKEDKAEPKKDSGTVDEFDATLSTDDESKSSKPKKEDVGEKEINQKSEKKKSVQENKKKVEGENATEDEDEGEANTDTDDSDDEDDEWAF